MKIGLKYFRFPYRKRYIMRNLKELIFEIKADISRFWKGYHYSDLWNIDMVLLYYIETLVEEFYKSNRLGHPSNYTREQWEEELRLLVKDIKSINIKDIEEDTLKYMSSIYDIAKNDIDRYDILLSEYKEKQENHRIEVFKKLGKILPYL